MEAGVNLCVFPTRSLENHHAAFLNNLANARAEKLLFFLDSTGRLLPNDLQEQTPVQLFRKGLGRVAIVAGGEKYAPAIDSPQWREAAAFLWKVRHDQSEAVQTNGTWDFDIVAEDIVEGILALSQQNNQGNQQGNEQGY